MVAFCFSCLFAATSTRFDQSQTRCTLPAMIAATMSVVDGAIDSAAGR
jgi:hypothetical protein